MEFAFETRGLRDICEKQTVAKDKLGIELAEALKHRLADLRAATTIADVLVGNCRHISGMPDEYLVIDLVHGQRLVIAANHPNKQRDEAGNVDWTKVNRIKFLRIESDNEN